MACFNVPGDVGLNDDESDLVLVQGVQAIVQQIRVGLQVFRGRWKYDRNAGVPFIEAILVNNPDMRVVRAIFWTYLMSVDGVSSIEALDLRLDRAERILYVDFRLKTEAGEIAEDSVGLSFAD